MAEDVLSMHKSFCSVSSNMHKACTCNIDPSGGWKDWSVFKNVFCSCRGPKFNSQHPYRMGHKSL